MIVAMYVRVYEWNGISWIPLGQDIDGELMVMNLVIQSVCLLMAIVWLLAPLQ